MLEPILARLDKVRKFGKGYRACCPVHQDKDPDMQLTEVDGKVLIHCHACGANGKQVVEAIGLPMKVLFSGDYEGPGRQERMLRDTALEDRFMVELYEGARSRGEPIRHSDYKRYKLAKYRQQLRMAS